MGKKYRIKLNLLGPGIIVLRIIGILCAVDLVAYALSLAAAVRIVSLVILIILCGFGVLLVIEQRQDDRLYRDAKKEDPEIP